MSLIFDPDISGFLLLAGIFWFGKKKGADKEPSVQTVTPEEFMRSPKTELPLGATVNVGSDVYVVESRAKYCEIEDGDEEDETLVSEEDFWWVLTLDCDIEDDDYFLSCEESDEGYWEFWFCADITDEVLSLSAFQGVSYHDENGAPPESFEYQGKTYEVEAEEFDETYFVMTEHRARKAKDDYFVQATSYVERASDGSLGEQSINFEMWESGTVVTIGQRVKSVKRLP
ncbi:MAG: hypothetical protein VYC39_08905 [Myxococcota bacterium]|nr:hypothetical protein [Myxococcota bacterium]